MTTFYDEMAVMALEMITEFGQPILLRNTSPGEYDPETGSGGEGVTTQQAAEGIVAEFTGLEFQRSTLIQQGDKKIKIAARDVLPPTLLTVAVSDIAVSNSYDYFLLPFSVWSVISVKETNPAGTLIVYELQGRR
jgi:hypothetical protein